MTVSFDLAGALGIRYPVLCGAMYPCSNPELIAAVSEAGGLGIVQPLTLVYVRGFEFREGLRRIREMTAKPIGMNVIVEKNSKLYERRMREWVATALEEGIRFFVSALGRPDWVVDMAHAYGALVFHDVTERRWAERAARCGVDGFVCVNADAGGHAGTSSLEELYRELEPMGLPLIAAGGMSTGDDVRRALAAGYCGVQAGTRFVASRECQAPEEYKSAIVGARPEDIVRTTRVTGVPLAVIRTPHVMRVGLDVGPVSRLLFRHPRTRHLVRFLYNVRAVRSFKRAINEGMTTKDYFQAGRSVAGIESILPVRDIMEEFAEGCGSAGSLGGTEPK